MSNAQPGAPAAGVPITHDFPRIDVDALPEPIRSTFIFAYGLASRAGFAVGMLRCLRDDFLGVVPHRPEHIAEQLDKIDQEMGPCRQLLDLVRAEFISCRAVEPTPLWGTVTAHDAAVAFAARVREGFDGLVRTASGNFDKAGTEYRPPSDLLAHWAAVLYVARHTRDHFPPLADDHIGASLCREATLAANARKARDPQPTPAPPPHPFDRLREQARALDVKGKALTVVLAICEGNGSVSLADLALQVRWEAPWQPLWNAMRARLNKKFRKTEWRFGTLNGEARVLSRKPTERK